MEEKGIEGDLAAFREVAGGVVGQFIGLADHIIVEGVAALDHAADRLFPDGGQGGHLRLARDFIGRDATQTGRDGKFDVRKARDLGRAERAQPFEEMVAHPVGHEARGSDRRSTPRYLSNLSDSSGLSHLSKVRPPNSSRSRARHCGQTCSADSQRFISRPEGNPTSSTGRYPDLY